MTKNDYYTPGVCNINEPEIAYRKKAGYLGVGIGAAVLVALLILDATPLLGLVMFIPVWLAAIGFLQAKNKFCVSYGANGVYNSDDEYAKTAKVVEEASHKLDKARVRKINTQALVAGICGAALTCLLLAVF